MKKKIVKFLLVFVVIGLLYFLLLLPTKYLFPLFAGTEVRLSITISMVGGLVFGLPAAMGIFVGNLAFDLIFNYNVESLYLIFLGSLFNALACLGIRYLFYLMNKRRNEYYIHDNWSIGSYVGSVIIINLALSAIVAALLWKFSSTDFFDGWLMTFLNNFIFSCMLGIPLLLYMPFILREATSDNKSIKDKTFRTITIFSLLSTIVLCILAAVFLGRGISDNIERWRRNYVFASFLLLTNTISFLGISTYITKKVTNPLHKLANEVTNDNDKDKNELDVLTSKLDFVASNKSKISGNEYLLFIGLSTKDGKEFKVDNAREIVNRICLAYVDGFISGDANGGYKGESNEYISEGVLVYKVFGATDEQINQIVKETLIKLEQESILVEKNHINRWYIYR